MKKILLLAALMLTASYVHAQAMVTGNLTIAGTAPACVVGACVHLNVSPEFGGATFTLNGTWSGTVTFYGSGDGGVTLVALTAFPSNSSTGVTSATGNGTWQTSLSGYTDAYLIFTTASSGTVVATINPSHISASSGHGSGSSGSAVTCSVSGGVIFETSSTTAGCDTNFVWNNTTKILDLNNVSSGAQGLNLTNTAAPSGYIAKEFFGGGPAGGGTANGNFVLETLGAGGALAGALEIATNTGGIQILGPSAGYNGGLGGGFITLTYDGTVTIQAPTGGPGVVFESPTVNFPGSSSGNASIAAAAAAGSPCTLVFPITSPSAGQVLSSAAPSGGSCQESWATVSTSTPSFSTISSGTNTTAAMVLGSGSSFAFTGTGSFIGLTPMVTTSVGSTPLNNGLFVQNSTAATSGQQQYSPSIQLEGQGWKTASTAGSQAVDIREYLETDSGSSAPDYILHFAESVAGGAYTDIFSVTSLNGGAFNVDANFLTAGAVKLGQIYNFINSHLLYDIFDSISIAGSGCGGSGASLVSTNGNAAFKIGVGTSNTGTCTVTMPTAATDWVCSATDITTTSTLVSMTKSVPTSGHLTTEITLQNYTDVSATHAWVDSDVIAVSCWGE